MDRKMFGSDLKKSCGAMKCEQSTDGKSNDANPEKKKTSHNNNNSNSSNSKIYTLEMIKR